jgi:DNA-binding NarL/FixJ family response regulator
MPRADGTPTPPLLVDDHEAVRAGLGALLREELASPDLIALGGVGAALEAAEQHRPELAIIDYRLPDGDGLSRCLRLKCAPPAPAVLIYSAFADGQLAVLALIAGADGVVGKGAESGELCEAVRAVAGGEARLPPLRHDVAETAGASTPRTCRSSGCSATAPRPARSPRRWASTRRGSPARRWAMLAQLRGRPTRRSAPRTGGVPARVGPWSGPLGRFPGRRTEASRLAGSRRFEADGAYRGSAARSRRRRSTGRTPTIRVGVTSRAPWSASKSSSPLGRPSSSTSLEPATSASRAAM